MSSEVYDIKVSGAVRNEASDLVIYMTVTCKWREGNPGFPPHSFSENNHRVLSAVPRAPSLALDEREMRNKMNRRYGTKK